ncbi:MAG: hypothetical protein E3J81_08380 [Dehalococcoidia bacterium]|nr:MAG: hypothetical protein E3J81_08380 [Dehalococcoidia bacterium]
MDEMKSAFERAMERAESLGKASEEDLRKWKYLPEGERLAAKYLKDECDLVVEIGEYDDNVRQHVVEGAQGILVNNIDLPRNELAKRTNKKAMEAIKELKRDKVSVENVYTKLRRIFNHYEQEGEQQRRQAYEAVKKDVEAKMQQAIQQQLGVGGSMKINVETQPQFQQEWRRTLAQLESQYLKLLDECKQEISNVP